MFSPYQLSSIATSLYKRSQVGNSHFLQRMQELQVNAIIDDLIYLIDRGAKVKNIVR